MRTHIQLKPTLPVEVVGKGKGFAFMVIDYGQEHHLLWVVAMDETREIWTVPNPDVRVQSNWTMGRMVKPSKPADSSLNDESKPQPPRCPEPYKDL